MSTILHFASWELGIAFFLLMMLSGWAGVYTQSLISSTGSHESKENTRIADASIALFALLLAFSFSGAADRYENRKGFRLDEAIAIGDFAATASMLSGSEREQIQQELVGYVKERLAFGSATIDSPEMQAITARSRESQQRIQNVLRQIITEKKSTTLHTPLMNGFNGITMTHDKALYGSQNQISDTIIILLVLFGLVSAFVAGRFGSGANHSTSFIQAMAPVTLYIALVTAVFFVVMDLEQPHRGVMRSSKAPLIDLLNALEQPAEQAPTKIKP